MSLREAPQREPNRTLHVYVGAVIALAAILVGAVIAFDVLDGNSYAMWPHIVVFTILLFVGETRRSWFRFHDGGEVSPGWAFAFGIVMLGSPATAVCAIAISSVWADLGERKSAMKVAFNVGQITLSLAIGALLLRAFGVDGALTETASIAPMTAIGVMIAGTAVFVINGFLTGQVMAIYHRTRLRSLLGRDFIVGISADGALLALSPVFVVAVTFSLYLLPLLFVTAALVFQSTQQALHRAHEANHDPLTKLFNRRAFAGHIEAFVLSAGAESGSRGAVLLFDLDGFKEVNDRLGHHIGDRLLQGVGEQILSAAPVGSVAARLGGDEFAILVPDVGDDREAQAMAEHLRRRLTRPIDVDGFPLSVDLSVGVALTPTHGRTPEELLSAADVAMYRAKRYRTGVELYKVIGARAETGRVGLLGQLSSALEKGELSVHYQPQTPFTSGEPNAVEALIRWRHPSLGMVPPGDFISLAEQTELIGPITEFVLRQAAEDAVQLDAFDLRMAVNVSSRNLQDRRFPNVVMRALDLAGLRPSRVELEITESAIASEPERSMYTIAALREVGISVAIDDFGTGYSSYSLLRDLHVDRLKIDRGFIAGLAGSDRQQHIVKSIVVLAKGLGLETVAEGVEDEETWKLLAELGCDVAQGFLIARPMAVDELSQWMDVRRRVSMWEQVTA
jgi:diguanylate cyclase